jgi:hypothetical protein
MLFVSGSTPTKRALSDESKGGGYFKVQPLRAAARKPAAEPMRPAVQVRCKQRRFNFMRFYQTPNAKAELLAQFDSGRFLSRKTGIIFLSPYYPTKSTTGHRLYDALHDAVVKSAGGLPLLREEHFLSIIAEALSRFYSSGEFKEEFQSEGRFLHPKEKDILPGRIDMEIRMRSCPEFVAPLYNLLNVGDIAHARPHDWKTLYRFFIRWFLLVNKNKKAPAVVEPREAPAVTKLTRSAKRRARKKKAAAARAAKDAAAGQSAAGSADSEPEGPASN